LIKIATINIQNCCLWVVNSNTTYQKQQKEKCDIVLSSTFYTSVSSAVEYHVFLIYDVFRVSYCRLLIDTTFSINQSIKTHFYML